MDLIAGIAILGFSAVYYFQLFPKEVFLANPFLPFVLFVAGFLIIKPDKPVNHSLMLIRRDPVALVFLKWILGLYLIIVALSGVAEILLKYTLPSSLSFISMQHSIVMITLPIIGVLELFISFRR